MLLEIAIGDAYGAGFEFAGKEFIDAHNNLEYTTHPSVTEFNVDLFRMDKKVIHPRVVGGRYTDDTQMTLAIAEVMLSENPWTKETLAESFVNAFKRDQRTGYAGRFYEFLCAIKDGLEFLQKIRPNSDKSGAAMRAAPVGIYPTAEEVIKKCTLQASLTHDTIDGIASANAAALMVHYFLYEMGPKSKLGNFLDRYISGNWDRPWKGFVSVKGVECVRAAITAVMESETLSEVLRRSISFGGDVDTVAAIAMGAASCCQELKRDIPENLIQQLENGSYGRDYIMDLDQKLMRVVDGIKKKKQSI